MIWCCWHRHPYGRRWHGWLQKDNNSEINTANAIFGEEVESGINHAIFHINFLKLSEKFFDSFIKHVHFSLSIDQERFIKEYLKEGDDILDNKQEGYKKPLDFYDNILSSFNDPELKEKIHNNVLSLPNKIKEDLKKVCGRTKENTACSDLIF